MKTTIQHDLRDCGAACLHMVAGYYGFFQPITRFRELTKTDKYGTSVYGLIDAAGRIGLKAGAMTGSMEDLLGGIEDKSVTFPFIAHILTENKLLHFVVVSGYKHGCFQIQDPARGKIRVNREHFSQIWTGYIVTFEVTDSFRKQKAPTSGLLRFFSLLIGQMREIALAVTLSVIISVIGILGAFVFHMVIDNCPEITGSHTEISSEEHVHEHAHEPASGPDGAVYDRTGKGQESIPGLFENIDRHSLAVIFPGLILMYLLAAVIQYARGRLIIAVSKKIDLNLTLPYFFKIMDMPVGMVEQRQTGDYLSRFSDAARIRDAISTAALTLVLDSLMAVGCGIILYMESRQLFGISFLIIVIYAWVVMMYRRNLSEANRNCMEENASVQSYLKESVDGIATVKAAAAEESVRNHFTRRFHSFLDAIVKRSRLGTTLDTIVTAVQNTGIAVILWCGFSMVLKGTLSLGSLITFYALLAYFIEPVKNLISLQPALQTASAAAERLSDIMDASDEADTSGSQPLPDVKRWEADHIDYRYGNNELTLRDVSLFVHAGEKVAIVGESGSGKSTLARLFLRFDDPESGEIRAEGLSLKEYRLDEIRKKVAYVDQNTFLFSGSIRENLLLGNADAGEKALSKACTSAGLEPFIQKLPFGLDTVIEENGSNLSGGQKQRIAIARALLKHPKLLILDEATSNLDTVTEAGIGAAISGLDPDMACIIIAHRLSTIKSCDRIYVMHEGRIVETGSHEELRMHNGIYARLLMNQ